MHTTLFRRTLAVISAGFLVVLSGLSSPAAELFVSPRGSDQNDGRSAGRAFATLGRARDEIRQLKSRDGLPAGGVTVSIQGGRYPLTETLEFTGADSGTAQAPVVYRASGALPVEILGGRVLPLPAFSPVTDPKILARLDPAARGKVVCLSVASSGLKHAGPFPPVFSDSGGIFELYWNGRRLPLSRWPNDGWATLKKAVANGDAKTGGTFEYREERPSRWLANPNVWLKGQWRVGWEDPAIRVASIDATNHTITFAAGIPNGIGNKYTRPAGNGKEPWCALNLIEEIDRPGEWAIDFESQTLFLWPPDADGELMIPQLDQPLIRVDGGAHLQFIGLTLETSLGDGIVLKNAESDLVAGCTIRNLARRGVILNGYRSGVQSCDIYGVGEGCVHVSGGDKLKLVPSENFVVNNHLHHYGVLKSQYSAGVDVGFGGGPNDPNFKQNISVGVRVAHNFIHDAPRDAVLVTGQDHVFEFNEIYNCGFGTADTGAFYSWLDWTIRGVVIRYNYMHDTVGGVNPDDGASGFTVFGNIFSGPRTGVWIASGPDHTIQNNIFVKAEGPVFGMDDRGAGRGYATNSRLLKAVMEIQPNQAPWSVRFPIMTHLLATHPELPMRTRFERNLIVMQTGQPIALKMRKERQLDTNLLVASGNFVTVADPGFVDLAKGNLGLKPESVVFQKIPGFEPIPFDQIGLQTDAYRRSLPSLEELGRIPARPDPVKIGDKNFGT